MKLTRLAVYSIEDVLDRTIMTPDGKKVMVKPKALIKYPHLFNPYVMFGEYRINMTSQRYQLFKTSGCKCVTCGVEGKFFSLDGQPNDPNDLTKGYGCHFNLIAIKPDGSEVLMTKDHIQPKSLGGPDELSNYQPMCLECNVAKGNGRKPKQQTKTKHELPYRVRKMDQQAIHGRVTFRIERPGSGEKVTEQEKRSLT